MLDAETYQTELPGHDARAGSARAGQREGRRQGGGPSPSSGPGVLDAAVGALFAFLGPIVYWLTWIAVVVAVVLLATFLLREAWRSLGSSSRAEPPPSPPPAEPPAPAAAAAPPSWPEIEALAAEGAFGEAVHLVFLHLLERLRAEGRLVLRSAATGREAVHKAELPGSSREDLADLVATVERFHFAGRELVQEDWERSRRIHRKLAEGEGGA